MGKHKIIILLAATALFLVGSPAARAIEVGYSAAQYCDQAGYYPDDVRSISTITVREMGASQSFMAGSADIGKTPAYFSLLAAHDGPRLHSEQGLFSYGRENSFIPELAYAVVGKTYLALTYLRREVRSVPTDATEPYALATHADRSDESEQHVQDADQTMDPTLRNHWAFTSSWMWGLRGLFEVVCLPDPEQACIFLENNPFGRAGDLFLRHQRFCGNHPHIEEIEGYEHHE